MQFTWTYDAPTGVYKNHALSNKLRFQAVREMVVAQFAKPEPGFGKKKGETMNIVKVKSLAVPTSAVLSETVKIPVDQFQLGTTAITVAEYGRAVEYTSLQQDLSKFDMDNPIQRTLKDQMKQSLDRAAAAAFKAAYTIAIPTGVAAITWDLADGTPSTSATENLTLAHLGIIRDYMRDTLIIPYYEGDSYMCIAATKALRGIKTDPEFVQWKQYLRDGDTLYNSEVGRLEQFRFVECVDPNILANNKGGSSNVGECLFFGSDGVAMIEADSPALRAGIPGDFGRSKAVAWYGVLAFGLIWPATSTAGEARVIRFTSS